MEKQIEIRRAEEKEPVTLEFLCWGAAEETTADAFKAMLDGFMENIPGSPWKLPRATMTP